MTGSDTHADTIRAHGMCPRKESCQPPDPRDKDCADCIAGWAALDALVADRDRLAEQLADAQTVIDTGRLRHATDMRVLQETLAERDRERARADRAEAALGEIEKEALIEGDMDIVNFVRAWLSVGRTDEKLMPANPDCPSCFGTGWATLRANGITVAGGPCVCRGGNVDAAAKPAIGREPTP